jgi:chromosome segregation ATPase
VQNVVDGAFTNPEIQAAVVVLVLAVIGFTVAVVRTFKQLISDASKKATAYDKLTSSRLDELEKESKSRSQVIEAQRNDIATSHAKLEALKNEINDLVIQRTEQVSYLKGQYQALSDRLKDYETQNVQLRAQIVSLERENKSLVDTVDKLRQQIAVLTSDKHNQELESSRLASQLSSLKEELQRRDQLIDTMQEQLKQLSPKSTATLPLNVQGIG